MVLSFPGSASGYESLSALAEKIAKGTKGKPVYVCLQADMAKECGRWGSSVEQWEQNLQDMRIFAGKRTGYLLTYIQEFFSLSDQQMRDYGFEV